MCMVVNKTIKPNKVNAEGYCVGWKVLTSDNKSPFSAGCGYQYKLEENVSSRPTTGYIRGEKVLDLFTRKNYIHRIWEGFHLSLTRKDARKIFRKPQGRKVIKVFYKPQDVVAYGTFQDIPNVVVTKLIVRSFESQ